MTRLAASPIGPSLAMVLVDDVPVGMSCLDAVAKEAVVEILAAGTIQSGAFLIAFGGEVEPVELSFDRALRVGGSAVRDRVRLAHADERIVPAMLDGALRWPAEGDTLGVLQSPTPPVMIRAVDAALKGAWVELVELRIGEGLVGKAVATLWGAVHDVQAAVALAHDAFARAGVHGCSTSVIANADPAVARVAAGTTRFFKEWRG